MPDPKTRRTAGALTGTLLLAGGALIWLHALRPDVNPFSRTISQYLVGDYNNLARGALFAAAAVVLALSLLLHERLAPWPQERWGRTLLWVASAALAVTAIVPPDVPNFEMPRTAGGYAHRIAAFVAFGALNAAMVAVTVRVRRDHNWHPVGKWLRQAMFAALGALVICALIWVSQRPLFGLGERMLALADWVWLLLMAWHLPSMPFETLAVAGDSQSPSAGSGL